MGSPVRRLTNPITRCWEPSPSPLCRDRRRTRHRPNAWLKTTYADESALARLMRPIDGSLDQSCEPPQIAACSDGRIAR